MNDPLTANYQDRKNYLVKGSVLNALITACKRLKLLPGHGIKLQENHTGILISLANDDGANLGPWSLGARTETGVKINRGILMNPSLAGGSIDQIGDSGWEVGAGPGSYVYLYGDIDGDGHVSLAINEQSEATELVSFDSDGFHQTQFQVLLGYLTDTEVVSVWRSGNMALYAIQINGRYCIYPLPGSGV